VKRSLLSGERSTHRENGGFSFSWTLSARGGSPFTQGWVLKRRNSGGTVSRIRQVERELRKRSNFVAGKGHMRNGA